jgi:hypothetical protein
LCQARRADARCAGVVRTPVVRSARYAGLDRVLGVVLASARRADVVPCGCGAVMPGADERHAPAAQPAVPADRFARKIVRFLAVVQMRSRQLNGNPLGCALKLVATITVVYF